MTEIGMYDNGPMLIAYPDSIGGKLSALVSFLRNTYVRSAFQSLYLLPSLYHSDLDRGFSVIDYDINEELAQQSDIEALKEDRKELMLDFILNHASAQSPQFKDLVKHGDESEYKDFFINWNTFWEGNGEMTEEGFILPKKEYLDRMFFRKPGLPLLMVRFPDGKEVPYWNTFYQEVRGQEYLGQMDLNIKSPLVWKFYEETLKKLAGYGARIVRLDAFAYAPKEPGEKNFLNEPGTFELLDKIRDLAEPYHLTLLPEIHATYAEGIYEKLANKGYLTYDFFLPGLILDAIEHHRGEYLAKWAKELFRKKIETVNMLGCHDGIPLLDLEGLLPQESIEDLTQILVDRGGYIKELHGQKNMYYQINMTYFSALGEDENKLLLARALQLFMPGVPQVWYLDLFAGKNDYEAVERCGAGGHKEINRTNISKEEAMDSIERDIVSKQLEMLRFRYLTAAFGLDGEMDFKVNGPKLKIKWKREGVCTTLTADLETYTFEICA